MNFPLQKFPFQDYRLYLSNFTNCTGKSLRHQIGKVKQKAHLSFFRHQKSILKKSTNGQRLIFSGCEIGVGLAYKSSPSIQEYEEEPGKNETNVESTQPGVLYHYFEVKEKYPLSQYYLGIL